VIRVTGLSKRYPGSDRPTLEGASFEVPEGGLTAILGLSGSGKSTLLRCLIGLEPFDAGEISVGGVVLPGLDGRLPPRRRAEAVARIRAQLGLVFQSFELFPHLSVLDNCLLAPMKVKGLSRAEAEGRARRLLEGLGLTARVDAFPEHLSGGQRQRVALARALCLEPRALLYDEPTSALDPSFKHEVLQSMRRVGEGGVTQVLVTHDVALARALAREVLILDQGRIAERGPAAEVLGAPKHEATRRLLAAERGEAPTAPPAGG
jgi:ABC-type polar amino acid transport system ATPase subunit